LIFFSKKNFPKKTQIYIKKEHDLGLFFEKKAHIKSASKTGQEYRFF